MNILLSIDSTIVIGSAKRLGGSSVGLPDIVAVNNNKGILLVIEAKSGTGESLYVPSDQIERCFSIVKYV